MRERRCGGPDNEFGCLLREVERAEAEFRFASPGDGAVDVACYRLLEAESRVRRYLREARRSAGLDCGFSRAPVYLWMRPGGRPQQVVGRIEGR